MTRDEFRKLTQNGDVLLLDGATGSNLYLAGMPRGVCTEQWVLEHPDVIINLQQAYAQAGSQVVLAPTFGANRVNLARYGLEKEIARMNRELVALSHQAAGQACLVAGDMTTLGELLESAGGEMEAEYVHEVYAEQAQLLRDAGVDLIVIETMISAEETEIALDAVRSVLPDLPVLCSMSVEADGRGAFGGNVFDLAETLPEIGCDALGINCSLGPEQMVSMIARLRELTDLPLIAKPNAGLPVIDAEGHAVYGMGAQEFVQHMCALHKAGASVLGGCCGTTPEYIRVLRRALSGQLITVKTPGSKPV